jgi:AcrR family transcriptional regulator
MSEKKAEYRSAVRSRNLIRQAYLELVQEKKEEKITVTDIVRKAGINRSTFYAHYPDVQGVVESFQDETRERMMEILSGFEYPDFFRAPLPVLQRINRYITEDFERYRILICQNSSAGFFRKLSDAFVEYMRTASDLPNEIRSSSEFEIRMYFFAGGIWQLYQQWFEGRLKGSPDDIAKEVSEIIRTSSRSFLSRNDADAEPVS